MLLLHTEQGVRFYTLYDSENVFAGVLQTCDEIPQGPAAVTGLSLRCVAEGGSSPVGR